ncbi:RHS repeat-associated core domain-containing protein [Bacteroidales bacterium OttesenSCG-928-E04]|nr:RHS repeat-associated core domain-containing protein [Bacteroidales bacterium OttesenSCG-928-E04]
MEMLFDILNEKEKSMQAERNFIQNINITKPKIHYFCDTIMKTVKNNLTPNFQPPTSYAGFPCSVFREPCSENWHVDQRRTGWDAMFTFSGKERDAETGYGYFGVRYYDNDLSIWLSVDPLARKYPSLSPYNYCANNPLKYIDPNGDSIAVLISNTAPIVGHMAVLIQVSEGENKGKWALYSKNGGNKTWSQSATEEDDLGREFFDSPQQFLESKKNKDEKYTQAYVLPTTKEQDDDIRKGFSESQSKPYKLLTANCAQAVQAGLEKAGLNKGNGDITSPNMNPDNRMANVIGNFIPHSIFSRIIQQNPGGQLIKRKKK